MAADLIWLAQVYLGLGAATALAFLGFGIDRIDENARGVWLFRPFLIPGILLIWPLVLLRWMQLERAGDLGAARFRPPLAGQPRLALAMAGAVIIIMSGAMILRQDGPSEAPAVQLEAPE
ncbi:hypothetical protein [Jannaschia sp. CCS1]|uniref:hypothetical protein n=1 Tax=Jannaschia sp. (strain CCS1) TaxID=290400 RepID=UPI000053A28F|nr:hypothetical protein [Jannaschia sp. CCS1]ABD56041.1 hypothetical protein Jann_3124 [Jannaschia sp. CCS1]